MPHSRRLARRRRLAVSPIVAQVESLEARTLLTFTYHGGPVISNMQAQNVFLGSDWSSTAALQTLATKLNAFTANMAGGTLTDGLSLAGYNVYRGTSTPGVVGNFTLDKSYPASGFGNGLFSFDPVTGNFSFGIGSNPVYTGGLADDPSMVGYPASVQGLLQTMITSGQVQTPNSNSLYVIWVEPGVIVSSDPTTAGLSFTGQPANSVVDFGAYHGSFNGTTAGGQSVDIRYAVMPFPGFPNGTLPGLLSSGGSTQNIANALNSLTVAASHEIMEAATDPDVMFANLTGDQSFVGWYDDDNGGEVCDLSQQFTSAVQGFVVQLAEDQPNLLINPNAVSHTLGAPANVAFALQTATSGKLTWFGTPLAQGYNIYTVSGTTRTLIGTVLGSASTTFTVNGLTAGSNVTYSVEAFNGPTAASTNVQANIPFAVPAGAGSFTINNFFSASGPQHMVQAGTNSVAFINARGGMALGTWIDSTHAVVAAWGNDVATFNGSNINWSDGAVWTQSLVTPPQLTATDYATTKGPQHAIQNGTGTILFINARGNMGLGSMTGPSQAVVAGWGNDVATLGSGGVNWSDGFAWTNPAITPTPLTIAGFANPNGSQSVIQGVGGALTFANAHGGMALGTWISATQALVAGWGNDVATFSGGKIYWSDGNVWNQASTIPPQITETDYTSGGGVQHTIQNGTGAVLFIDASGTMALGTWISTTQLSVSAWNNDIATLDSSSVKWKSGKVWTKTP